MRKLMFILGLLVFCKVVPMTQVHAAEKDTGYSVSPVFSEHQSPNVLNFFDIRWTPSAVENFELNLTNNTDKERTYQIQVNKARTNKNGIVDYSDKAPEDQSAPYKLTEMVQIAKEVTVAAKSSVPVKGSISFPDKDFNGILMAGFYVSEKAAGTEQSGVSNVVVYNLPLLVRGNSDKRPDPVLTLDSVKVEKFSQDTYSLTALLQNKGPNLMKAVQFTAEIKDEKGKKILTHNSELILTPETSFDYPIQLPSSIKAGKYSLTLRVKHNDTDHWKFSKNFEITSQDANKIKASSTSPKSSLIKWILYGVIIAIVLILVVVTVVILLK